MDFFDGLFHIRIFIFAVVLFKKKKPTLNSYPACCLNWHPKQHLCKPVCIANAKLKVANQLPEAVS